MTERQFVVDMMDMLSAPIIVYSDSWADSVPERIKKIIPQARMIAGLKKEQLATWPEVAAYLMTASFNMPLNHDAAEIYIYAGCKTQELFGKDIWDQIKPDRSLSVDQERLCLELRRWIYERRRKEVDKKVSKSKKHAETRKDDVIIEPVIQAPTQLSLW